MELFKNASLATADPLGVAIVGEALGAEEEKQGAPFVGPAGRLLTSILKRAGLVREQLHVLNVFNARPPENNLEAWCGTKAQVAKSPAAALPPLQRGKYLLPQHLHHLERLRAELAQLQPRLIIGLGNTPLWALTGLGQITKNRGVIIQTPQAPALFTYHPAGLLREYKNLPIATADLRKARLWLEGRLPTPLTRTIVINPTLAELSQVYGIMQAAPDRLLGVDIETAPACNQITTIAFGWPELAICIPIWDKETTPEHCNVSPDPEQELERWHWIKAFCELPNPKVLQNGLYDMSYLLMAAPLELRIRNVVHDTAIMQHAMQPELKKDLGTLASLYLNEPLWKHLRLGAKDSAEQKADE